MFILAYTPTWQVWYIYTHLEAGEYIYTHLEAGEYIYTHLEAGEYIHTYLSALHVVILTTI